jgi:putative ABC transport system permease protein
MISLAGRDILHAWGKFVFTGIGLGLLIGVTLVMAGVYRGMVDDGRALLDNSGADCGWCSRTHWAPMPNRPPSAMTSGAACAPCPGVARAANVTYLTMQVAARRARRARDGGGHHARPGGHAGTAAVPGGGAPSRAPLRGGGRCRRRFPPGRPHPPAPQQYTVVGLTRRMVSSGGDPMVFIPLQGRPGGAVPQGQRRHPGRAPPHRCQSRIQPARRARIWLRCGDPLAKHQRLRQRRAGAPATGHAPRRSPNRIRAGCA